jgi:exonuclease VII large subunit
MVIEKEEAFAERIEAQTRRLGELLRYEIQDLRGDVNELARNRIFQNFQVKLANLARRVDDLETRGRNVLRAERQAIAEHKGAALLAAERLGNILRRTVGERQASWERLAAAITQVLEAT